MQGNINLMIFKNIDQTEIHIWICKGTKQIASMPINDSKPIYLIRSLYMYIASELSQATLYIYYNKCIADSVAWINIYITSTDSLDIPHHHQCQVLAGV